MKKLLSILLVALMVLGMTCAVAEDLSGLAIGWCANRPHVFHEAVKAGADVWAEEYAETGVEVIRSIPADNSTTTQQAELEGMVAQGVKYISVFPSDSSFICSLAKEFKDYGITMITYSAQPSNYDDIVCTVGVDYEKAAYDAAVAVFEAVGDGGKVINVLDNLNDPNTIKRKAGVERALADYPNITLLAEVSGGMASSEEAYVKITDTIAAYAGEVDGMIATGGNVAVGMAMALEDYYQTENPRTIVGIGIDEDPSVMKAIENGWFVGTIAQNSAGMGYLSCEALKLMSQGYVFSAEDKLVNAGYTVVTKDNMNDYAADLTAVTEQLKATLATDYFTAP